MLARRTNLKRRDSGDMRVVLVVLDSRQNRAAIRAASDMFRVEFPIPARHALAAFDVGADPGGDTLIAPLTRYRPAARSTGRDHRRPRPAGPRRCRVPPRTSPAAPAPARGSAGPWPRPPRRAPRRGPGCGGPARAGHAGWRSGIDRGTRPEGRAAPQQRRRPETRERLPQLRRRGHQDRPQLDHGRAAGLLRGAPREHQQAQCLDVPVGPLGPCRGRARQHRARGRLGIERVALAQPATGLPVGAVDLPHRSGRRAPPVHDRTVERVRWGPGAPSEPAGVVSTVGVFAGCTIGRSSGSEAPTTGPPGRHSEVSTVGVFAGCTIGRSSGPDTRVRRVAGPAVGHDRPSWARPARLGTTGPVGHGRPGTAALPQQSLAHQADVIEVTGQEVLEHDALRTGGHELREPGSRGIGSTHHPALAARRQPRLGVLG